MDAFFDFMERPVGRALRIVLGLFLVYLGFGRLEGLGRWIVGFVGLLPIGMGLWGPCLPRLLLRRPGKA